jgi:hypothetical protein
VGHEHPRPKSAHNEDSYTIWSLEEAGGERHIYSLHGGNTKVALMGSHTLIPILSSRMP